MPLFYIMVEMSSKDQNYICNVFVHKIGVNVAFDDGVYYVETSHFLMEPVINIMVH